MDSKWNGIGSVLDMGIWQLVPCEKGMRSPWDLMLSRTAFRKLMASALWQNT